MITQKERFWFRVAAILTITASVLYCSWPLGFILNPQADRNGLASELGAHGQPYNWVFILGDIASGALLVAASILLAKQYKVVGWRKAGIILLGIYGVCAAFDAALPLRCLPSEQVCGPIWNDPILILHGVIDMIGSVALVGTLVAEGIYAYKSHRSWLPWIYAMGIGGLLFAFLSLYFLLTNGPGYWAQRYYITLSCVWVASIPYVFKSTHQAQNDTK